MSISSISSGTRQVAQQLVAFEAATKKTPDDVAHATCRVCEKLRIPLVTLTGTAGHRALLSRALTLAKREAPALSDVEILSDGSLSGLKGDAAQAHPVLVAYLLGLLVTFIGLDLTMRLVHDIWPDFPDSNTTSSGRNSDDAAQ